MHANVSPVQGSVVRQLGGGLKPPRPWAGLGPGEQAHM